MLWLLFAILCHRRFLESSLSAGYWWLALSSSLALMGKFHWGIVYLAFVGTLPVAAALSRKPIARPVVAAAVSFTATGMMYLTFLGSPDGQAIEFGYRRDLVISGIAILLVRLIWSGSMGGTAVGVIRAVGVAAFFCVALWALIGGVYRTDFLFPAAAALTAVVVIPSVMNSLPETRQFHRFMIPLLAIGFVSGAALAFGRLIVTGVWRYDGEIPLGPFNRVWLPDALLVLSIIGIALVWKLAFTRRSAVNTLQFASLFAIVASLGAFAVQINKPIVHRVLFGADDFPSSIITEDQTAAGRWLAANAAPTDIAASNSLCPTELVVGEMVPDNDPENRCDGRNQNAWISALGNRQVLIESPAYGPLAYSQVKNPDHVIWYRSSVDFGRSADDSARQTLEEFEVRWFLVDLQLSDVDDWSIRKDTVYINDSYAIVDLEIRE
jgi:hypothetical protein